MEIPIIKGISPRIHLVFGRSISEKFEFQEPCKKVDCPHKGIKVCPHVLVNKDKIIRTCGDFLHYFSMCGHLPHISFGDEVKKWKFFDYLIFFLDGDNFHEKASEFINKVACLTPIFPSD